MEHRSGGFRRVWYGDGIRRICRPSPCMARCGDICCSRQPLYVLSLS